MYVCISGICLPLSAQITLHKHPPHLPFHITNTHTYTHTHAGTPKEKEVWIMLALRDGRANQTHLETIGDRAQKQRKVGGGGGEGREERGEESPPFGE